TAHVIRMATFRMALQTMERMEAQGEDTDAELDAFQRVLHEATVVPVLAAMARDDRGAYHYFLSSLEAGDLPSPGILLSLGITGPWQLPRGSDTRRLHAWLLQQYTEFVAIARQPPENQPPLLARLEEKSKTAPLAGTPLFEALIRDPFRDQKPGKVSA